MSNYLAVAHVAAAIRQLVIDSQALTGTGDIVFGRPAAPDSGARINICLYHVSPHAGMRNADLPFRRGDALVRRPQAAIVLHFLISFYGREDELQPARMMAAVVRDLHAHAVLKPQFIADARGAHGSILTDSDLGDSGERIILTPQGLSLEEMSRLWSIMVQTPYALSVAYEAAVILLDARETAPAPLPALRRGEEDRGPAAQTEPLPRIDSTWIGFPEADSAAPRPQSLRSAQLGALLRFEGVGLAGDSLRLDFDRTGMARVSLPMPAGAPVVAALPDPDSTPPAWRAGLYAVTAVVTRAGREQRSPVWPLPLAPRVSAIAPSSVQAGIEASVTISCRPEVGLDQSALLLAGDLEIAAEARLAAGDPLVFTFIPDPAMDQRPLILRVDGVDSQPIRFDPATGLFAFDDAQRLTVT